MTPPWTILAAVDHDEVCKFCGGRAHSVAPASASGSSSFAWRRLAPVLAIQYGEALGREALGREALGRLRTVRPDLCVIVTESNASLLKDIPDQVWTMERGELSAAAHST